MKAVLAKVFGAREKLAKQRGHDDKEMPFLEHLEELRQTLMKIIITLIIVTIGAFVFREPLMDFIKRPVELAGLGATIDLPDDVNKQEWRRVQTLAKTARDLDPDIRTNFFAKALGEEEAHLSHYVQALPIFNATLVLDKEVREAFVREALSNDTELRDTVLKLVEKNPDAKVDRQGNLIEMSALNVPEVFMLSLKISLFAGLILSLPLLLYFLAQFIFPGLTAKEKRAVLPAVGIGFGLFLVGAAFAYWVVTPRVLEFFHGYADELGVASEWRIGYYVSFVSQLVLIFGLSFELPVVVLTLVKLEILSYQFMAKNRSYAIIIIFTVAAIITPTPDAPTLCLLAVPMVILYEFCIWMAFFMDRKRKRLEAEEEAERALARERRSKERAEALAKALPPAGTVAQSATSDEPGSPPAAMTDDDAKSAFDANDALQDDDADSPPEHDDYEEGFGPPEDIDSYNSEDFHNQHYQESEDRHEKDTAENRDRVDIDDQPSIDQREDEPRDASDDDEKSEPPSDTRK